MAESSARVYPAERLSPGLTGAPEDEHRMACRQPGCWRFGAPQLDSVTKCYACGSPTVSWPLDAYPTE